MQKVVLLVEDDPIVAMPVEDALLEAGFQVQLVVSAETAIAALEQRSDISGLITDIRLNGPLTGWDVARRARELDPDLPVIYVSGDSGIHWKANGVPDSIMIEKPYALAQVITAISQLLNAAPAAEQR